MCAETPSSELSYVVPGMSCSHCKAAITEEVTNLAGVAAVDVDLDSKRVTVRGSALDDTSIREAIGEAGYEAAA
jgi:copper chaperone